MKTKENKENDEKTAPEVEPFFYLNDEAKNWDFSDYVRVTSGPRGMILSFGKFVLAEKKYGIFKEIILPFDVAKSLNNIIKMQFEELLKKGLIKELRTPEK